MWPASFCLITVPIDPRLRVFVAVGSWGCRGCLRWLDPERLGRRGIRIQHDAARFLSQRIADRGAPCRHRFDHDLIDDLIDTFDLGGNLSSLFALLWGIDKTSQLNH